MPDSVNVSPALESKIMKLHSRMEETVVQGRRRRRPLHARSTHCSNTPIGRRPRGPRRSASFF